MEVWKDIPGYEGKYQVSTLGNVRGLDYIVYEKSGKSRLHKGRILKTFKVTGGYHCLKLQVGNKKKHFLVHRLVAMAFIPNPNNYDTVNHKDENVDNNRVENLEWLSLYQNNRYGSHDNNMRKSLSKPVLQYSMDGTFIREFESFAAVKRLLGFNASNVNKAAKGIHKSAKGYIWKYKEE